MSFLEQKVSVDCSTNNSNGDLFKQTKLVYRILMIVAYITSETISFLHFVHCPESK
jgi:hypothetical protein